MLGWDSQTHVDMIDDKIAFHDLTLFLSGQFMKDLLQLFTDFPIDCLLAILGDKHNMIFTIPARMS